MSSQNIDVNILTAPLQGLRGPCLNPPMQSTAHAVGLDGGLDSDEVIMFEDLYRWMTQEAKVMKKSALTYCGQLLNEKGIFSIEDLKLVSRRRGREFMESIAGIKEGDVEKLLDKLRIEDEVLVIPVAAPLGPVEVVAECVVHDANPPPPPPAPSPLSPPPPPPPVIEVPPQAPFAGRLQDTISTSSSDRNHFFELTRLSNGQFASACDSDGVSLWQQVIGGLSRIGTPHRVAPSCRDTVQLPNGQLVVSDASQLHVWDVVTSKKLRTIQTTPGGDSKLTSTLWCLAVLGNGNVAAGFQNQVVKVFDPEDGRNCRELKGHTSPVRSLCALPDGSLASACWGGRIFVWNTDTGESSNFKAHVTAVNGMGVLPNNRIVSVGDDRAVKVWNLLSYSLVHSFVGHTGRVLTVAVLANGQRFATADESIIRVWDLQTLACTHTIGERMDLKSIRKVVALDDGRLVTGSTDGKLRVWC